MVCGGRQGPEASRQRGRLGSKYKLTMTPTLCDRNGFVPPPPPPKKKRDSREFLTLLASGRWRSVPHFGFGHDPLADVTGWNTVLVWEGVKIWVKKR